MNAYLSRGVKWNASRYGYMLPPCYIPEDIHFEEGVTFFNSMEGLMDVYKTVEEMNTLEVSKARKRWNLSIYNKILKGKRKRKNCQKEAQSCTTTVPNVNGRGKKKSKIPKKITVRIPRKKKYSKASSQNDPSDDGTIVNDIEMIPLSAMNAVLESNSRMMENMFMRILDRLDVPSVAPAIMKENDQVKKIFFAVMEKGVGSMLHDSYTMSSRRINSRNLVIPFDREIVVKCLPYNPILCLVCKASAEENSSCFNCEIIQPRMNYRRNSPTLSFSIKSIIRLVEVFGNSSCVRRHGNGLTSYLCPWVKWKDTRCICISIASETAIIFLPVATLQDVTTSELIEVPILGYKLGSLETVSFSDIEISSTIIVNHQGGGKLNVSGELCVFDSTGLMSTGKNY